MPKKTFVCYIDIDNGYDGYPVVIKAKDEEEAYKKILKWLEKEHDYVEEDDICDGLSFREEYKVEEAEVI